MVLDLSQEAEWVAPLIVVATQIAQPMKQWDAIPGDRLALVTDHDFDIRRY